MTEHIFNLLKKDIEGSKFNAIKLSKITKNSQFLEDAMSGAIIFEIKEDNRISSNISFYDNLKCFFDELSEYDVNNIVKTYLYLKGVTEITTNEELFN